MKRSVYEENRNAIENKLREFDALKRALKFTDYQERIMVIFCDGNGADRGQSNHVFDSNKLKTLIQNELNFITQELRDMGLDMDSD